MITAESKRILIADDEPLVVSSLGAILRHAGYEVSEATSAEDALGILGTETVQLVIADLRLPRMDGIELARRVIADWGDIPVIMLTGYGSVEKAVEAMKSGASDFLMKPPDPDELLEKIAERLGEKSLRPTAEPFESWNVAQGERIVGTSESIRRIRETIDQVSSCLSAVLIEGETGTGKELIARAIHRTYLRTSTEDGRRPEVEYPYVAVNCGAFSRTLLESQLFGHKRGAFSGAVAGQEGVFVAARRGTLFLDEISELDLDLQVKMLRAVQEREVIPVGATRAVSVNARIIAATNQSLESQVRRGRFRPDLYHRLNVVRISIPPLRERKEDIAVLTPYYVDAIGKAFGVPPLEVGDEVYAALDGYDWPGNVRELLNVIERAYALRLRRLTVGDLPSEIREPRFVEAAAGASWIRVTSDTPANSSALRSHVELPTFDEAIRGHLEKALSISRGVKSRAARRLGIDRNRLARLMRKYRL